MKSHANSPIDLSSQLRSVEETMKRLLGSGLTRKAVLVLLAYETKLPMKDVNLVLEAATSLSKWAVRS